MMRFRIPKSFHAGGQRILVGLLLVVLLPLLALAAELPALTGRIVDNAGLLDGATEAALSRKLEEFEKKSSDQIVIATVPDLGGDDIESYANRLFRAWGLGQASENNGVLLLVARDDRKMRIEVGYGLEGTLTDLHSKLIINNTMAPAFRGGDFSGGIAKAVDDIVMVLEGNGAELEARARRNQQTAGKAPDETIFFAIFFIILFGGIFLPIILAPIYGQKIGPGRYRWLGQVFDYRNSGRGAGGGSGGGGGGWSSGGGGWSSGGGGFSGGGGSSGGGGASGSW